MKVRPDIDAFPALKQELQDVGFTRALALGHTLMQFQIFALQTMQLELQAPKFVPM